ncbi:type II toxin-antitoxin system HigB family toxin [Candidatus Gracilibacteria bacterium]|nr:type II toxin-antitoxin system HigB family toxin [Candidatus Gracilibacteria bacterium]
MRIIARSALVKFRKRIEYNDAEEDLKAWYKIITCRNRSGPQDIIACFNKVDNVGNGRLVFNICWNKYRLIASFNYETQKCYIRFIGTHTEYDRIKDIKNI